MPSLPFPMTWPPVRRAVSDESGWVRMPVDDLAGQYDWILFQAKGYAPEAMGLEVPEYPVELRRGFDIPIELRDGRIESDERSDA